MQKDVKDHMNEEESTNMKNEALNDSLTESEFISIIESFKVINPDLSFEF